jgi:hypothetical protein
MDVDRVAIRQTDRMQVDKDDSACFNCGKKGHWAAECRESRSEGSTRGSNRRKFKKKGKFQKKKKFSKKGKRIRSMDAEESDEDQEESSSDEENLQDETTIRELTALRSIFKDLPTQVQKSIRKEINKKGF